MTNDNTRTKANAVFFSVLMVLSMVAVGFAAAPAAASDTSSAEITLEDQAAISGTDVTVDISNLDSGNNNVSVILTYSNSTDDLVVANATAGLNATADSSPTIKLASDTPEGEYTAHVLNNTSTVRSFVTGLSDGQSLDESSNLSLILNDDTGIIGANDGTRVSNSDVVYNGSTIFQGEDGLTFVDEENAKTSVTAGQLQKTAGDTQGTALSLPIGENTATGTYASSSGYEVVVQEPRITTAEVVLASNGNDVSQVNPNTNLEITAEWNFEQAEDLDLTVEDASGTDITNQVVDTNNQTLTTSGENVALDLDGEDAGDYTVIFEGSDDLDYGGVVEEYTITKTNDDTVSIDIAEDSATQGDNVEYTVSGGTDGETYLVVIEDGDYADGVSNGNNAANIFRNVGDTVSVDNHTESSQGGDYAYAEVEIDGTQAVGSIETQYLDDTSITVDVYGPNPTVGDLGTGDLSDSADDDSIDITEGEISLTSPSGTYTVGDEVDVNGTSQSADNVRIYAQNNNDWEIVDLGSSNFEINVESDDTFESEDVVLSAGNAGGNDILSFSGNYRIGAIDAAEAATIDADDNENIEDSTITTSEWTSASSTRSTINVVEGDLSGEFLTYNGQVADLDGAVDVEGAATGQDNVLVVFVGERGTIQTHTVSVDSDGTFDETDLSVGSISQGTASAHIISLGRDSVFGDTTGDISNLESNISSIGSGSSLSGAQVRDRVVALTTEADASDDLMVTQTFRLNDGQVSIDSVAPEGSDATGINPVAAGDSMVVSGTTNRQADDNSIVVNVYDSEGNSIASEDTDEWGTDGQYTVTIDTSEIETGTYSVEADTGDNTDRAEIEIVESVEEETTEEETEEETTEEETTEEETTEEDTTEETTEEETTEEETTEEETTEEEATDDSTPGFGALVALVALVAAALLATRRRDE